MDKRLPNFKHMDAEQGKIYGKYNVVKSINPYKCYFIAHYLNEKKIRGRNLFDTGWNKLPDGITLLQYHLSTGHVINIPKFKAYLALVEVSEGLDGSRIFHALNVKGMGDNEVINYKIILKQDYYSKHKIGDIIISKDKKMMQSSYWKFSA